jgi:phosphatidylglycerol---prolipoprotein diacylglyceryl transferase
MSNQQPPTSPSRRLEPYWLVIIAFFLAALGLYAYHLATGRSPNRVAVRIAALNFDIYWYGVIIVGGIALGSYVTSRLAANRARQLFHESVPVSIRDLPLSELALPEDVEGRLRTRGVDNLGRLLFEMGLDPLRLALKREAVETVRAALSAQDEVDAAWLEDPPWRRWNPDHVWSGVAWALVLGVIGARIYHILTPSPSMAEIGIHSPLDYLRNPMQMVNIRSGGLGIYGGLIGGALGIWIYSRRQRLPALAWVDLAVIGLALGQAVGRWGNFFNQELYGRPTGLPWAVYIAPSHRLTGYQGFETFHPAFLYASLLSLATFLILYGLHTRRGPSLKTGDLTAVYLVLESTSRILLELVRLDSRTLTVAGLDLGLPVATVVSIVIGLPMAGLLIWRRLQPGRPT